MSVPQNKDKALQKRMKQMMEEREQNAINHNAYVQFLKETILNKLVLVGIQGQAVSRTFVTDIVGDMVGAIAIAVSTDPKAGDDGMYFDIRQLTFYKAYTEAETKEYMEKITKENEEKLKLMAPNVPLPKGFPIT